MLLRLPQNYFSKPFAILLVGEALVFLLAFYLGKVASWVELRDLPATFADHLGEGAVYVAAATTSMFAMGLYHGRYSSRFADVFIRTFLALALTFVLLSVVFYVSPSLEVWRSALLVAMPASLGGVFALRYAFLRLIDSDLIKRRILVLGTGEQAAEIEKLEESQEGYGFLCVGYLRVENVAPRVAPARILSRWDSISELCREHQVGEIVVAMQERRGMVPLEGLLDCKFAGIPIYDFMTFMERETGRCDLNALRPSWFIYSDGIAGGRVQQALKRGFDVVVSLVLLVLTLPLLCATGIAIRVESPGPVFYRQPRVGLGGRTFEIIKFRSMRVDAEADGAPVWAARNDPRITSVGQIIRKFRIDELPQVINVFKGDMSFVGPRPERPEFVALLAEKFPYYTERHRVKPGITGWAQLHYIYSDSVEGGLTKLQYDLYYIRHYSFLLDLFIVIQTARVILWPAGAR